MNKTVRRLLLFLWVYLTPGFFLSSANAQSLSFDTIPNEFSGFYGVISYGRFTVSEISSSGRTDERSEFSLPESLPAELIQQRTDTSRNEVSGSTGTMAVSSDLDITTGSMRHTVSGFVPSGDQQPRTVQIKLVLVSILNDVLFLYDNSLLPYPYQLSDVLRLEERILKFRLFREVSDPRVTFPVSPALEIGFDADRSDIFPGYRKTLFDEFEAEYPVRATGLPQSFDLDSDGPSAENASAEITLRFRGPVIALPVNLGLSVIAGLSASDDFSDRNIRSTARVGVELLELPEGYTCVSVSGVFPGCDRQGTEIPFFIGGFE